MRVKLAYGKDGLWLDLPDGHVTVVEPQHEPALPDEAAAIRAALRAPIGTPPLRELVRANQTVAIVFSDITRAQPRQVMLSALLAEIGHVPRAQVTLINALGTHRANSPDELAGMLGRDIAGGYRIVQHDAYDDTQLVRLGTSSRGHEISVNAAYMRADVKVLTGFIEPHFFAGFSGGPKAVLPGIAGHRSVFGNHDAGLISDPRATWGITEGNPIWEEMREVALLTRPDFLLNVSLNRDKRVTGVFAGELLQAHAAGTRFVARNAMQPVDAPFDIVITSNSGYPLDMNLYQTVKGMSAAAQIVKPGGAIIMAAECVDGVPAHGEYGKLLQRAGTPAELLAMVRAFDPVRQDQWQVQIQAQIQLRADVYVRSTYLNPDTIAAAKLHVCTSIEDTLAQLLDRYGPDATVCVLPEGPMTIPFIQKTN